MPAESPALTELTIMRVMEMASESFQVSNYAVSSEEKPSVPPEADIDADLEPAQVVPPPSAGPHVAAGSANAGAAPPLNQYSPPIPVIMTWPQYPPSARRKGIRGTVIVRVHVSAGGSVDGAEVISGLEDEACRRAAIESAAGLRFLPALVGEKPVDSWFSYPVEFGKGRR